MAFQTGSCVTLPPYILCEPLAAIFNASIREGYFPPILKSAEVVPVPKTHPPTSIQDHLRPISLLPTLSKVFESIVGQWFLSVLERLWTIAS